MVAGVAARFATEYPGRGVRGLEGGAGSGELIEIVGSRQAGRDSLVVGKVAATVLLRFGDFVKTLRELLIKLHGIVLTKTHFSQILVTSHFSCALYKSTFKMKNI